MASTNHTPTVGLSQFLPLDKPSWTGDYNSDMGKIDAAFAQRDTAIATLQAQLSDALTRLHALDGK